MKMFWFRFIGNRAVVIYCIVSEFDIVMPVSNLMGMGVVLVHLLPFALIFLMAIRVTQASFATAN